MNAIEAEATDFTYLMFILDHDHIIVGSLFLSQYPIAKSIITVTY